MKVEVGVVEQPHIQAQRPLNIRYWKRQSPSNH